MKNKLWKQKRENLNAINLIRCAEWLPKKLTKLIRINNFTKKSSSTFLSFLSLISLLLPTPNRATFMLLNVCFSQTKNYKLLNLLVKQKPFLPHFSLTLTSAKAKLIYIISRKIFINKKKTILERELLCHLKCSSA